MLGIGLAVGFAKEIIVLIPEAAEKPYTSLVLPYTTKSMAEAMKRLSQYQSLKSSVSKKEETAES